MTVKDHSKLVLFSAMKTITLKADETFDALLTELAKNLKTTKSGVVRAAVLTLAKRHLERVSLRSQVREASLKVREDALQYTCGFDAANADGL